MEEKKCIITSSDNDVEDLSAFVTERLQCLSEGSVEKFIGNESVNVEEILCGNIDVEKDGGGKKNGSTEIISTPKRAAWIIYSKRASSALSEQYDRPCKALMFDVTSGSGTVGGVEFSRGYATIPSEGVPGCFVTSGGFYTLKGIAQRQADESFVGARMDDEGEGMVRGSQVDQIIGQEAIPKERTKYYLSQSANSLLKDFFELNPPTHLDPIHPTTSFSADQLIQFVRAVGLEVSLASYSMLEDLLLKARGDSRAYPVTSRYPAGKSLFSNVAGSSMGDSVASRSIYSLPSTTETESTIVVMSGDVLEEPCSSR